MSPGYAGWWKLPAQADARAAAAGTRRLLGRLELGVPLERPLEDVDGCPPGAQLLDREVPPRVRPHVREQSAEPIDAVLRWIRRQRDATAATAR